MHAIRRIWLLALGVITAGADAQLPSFIDLNVPPGSEATAVTRLYGDEASERFGAGGETRNVAHGDVNGDGFDDLIIGATFTTPMASVYVVFGDAALPSTAELDFDTDGAISGAGETRIRGDQGLFGNAVATGDINGDGFDDIVIGDYTSVFAPDFNVGEVYVIYGSASFPEGQIIDLDTGGTVSTAEETRIRGDDAFDSLGYSVATGDVNGDGHDDIIAGAIQPTAGSGEVWVIYGSATLPNRIVNLDTDGAISAFNETRILGDDDADQFGHSVAAGDVNGDGFDDIIAGARNADPPGGALAGEAVIIFGGPTLPGQVVDLDTDGAISAAGETRIFGDDAGDRLGYASGAGDIDGDGYADVMISAYAADSPTAADAGALFVIWGSPTLPGASIDLDTNGAISASGETRVYGPADNPAWLGWEADLGDVNGDGLVDLIGGARTTNPGGLNNAGSVHVIYGSGSLPGTLVDLGVVSSEVTVTGISAEDRLGFGAHGGGDLDGDGFADFGGTAFSGDNPSIGGSNNAGTVAVIYGDGTAPSATASQFSRAGDGPLGDPVPPADFGPVVRATVDYSDHDFGTDGSGGAPLTTATLTRSSVGIFNLGPSSLILPVVWEVTTDRSDLTGTLLTFHYLDSELAAAPSVVESDISIHRAPTLSGPWTQLGTTVDTARNTATAFTSGFSFFALATVSPTVPAELSVFLAE